MTPPNAQRPTIATPQFGLSALNDKGEIQSICPLERTDVRSDIAGNLARVVVVQRFSNPSKTPIEALYTFPLPHDAAVDGMTFQIEDGKALASRFYNRVANPVLLDLKTDWQGLPVAEVFPRVVPDVYESGPVVLTGRFTKGATGELVVKGRAAGKDWAQRVKVDFNNADKNGAAGLPSAWARQKIEDLSNTTPTPTSGETADDLRGQITDVALDYHLMSPYTSFVAVEPTVVNVGGEQKTVEVPTEMADGVSYQGIFGAREVNGRVLLGLGSVSQNIAGSAGGVPILGDVPLIGGLFRSSVAGNASLPSGIGQVTAINPTNGMLIPGAPGVQDAAATPRTDALESRLAVTESKVVAPPRLTFAPQMSNGGNYFSGGRRFLIPSAEELAKMTPEARIITIRANKMSEAVGKLAAQKPAAKVTVQLWLWSFADEKTKADFFAKLKELGWTQSAVLTVDKLVLGEISSDHLDDVAALAGVMLVEMPKFK